MKHKLTIAVMALLLTLGLSTAARADTVNFTLTQSLLGAHPGNTVTFEATVSVPAGPGGDVYFNGVAQNLGTLTVDENDFYANSPVSLAPGQSATFDIFTVAIPFGTPMGTYGGSFSILGGADGSANDVIGTVTFSVAATPEPSSFLLLGSGLAGLVGVVRRKRLI